MTIKIENYNMLNAGLKKMVDMIAAGYVQIMGLDKWNSLTAKEQHDVVMILAADFNNNL